MEEDFKLRPHIEIPDRKDPGNAKGIAEYSVDVFIIDEDDCKGVAYYDFLDEEWSFHTEHFMDEMKFVWFYGPEKEIG